MKDFINGAMSLFTSSFPGVLYPLGKPENMPAFIAGGVFVAILLVALLLIALVAIWTP